MKRNIGLHGTVITTVVTLTFVWATQTFAQTTQPSESKSVSKETTEKTTVQTTEKTTASDPIEDFIQKTKNPTPWLNWGADARLRDEWFINAVRLSKQAAGNEEHYQRYRARFWTSITPMKDLEVFTRFTWEGRNVCSPDTFAHPNPNKGPISRGWVDERDMILIDALYVKYSNAFGLPLTIQAGRQDIVLGDGWWTGDGGPLDGSRTLYTDAIRAKWEFKDIKTSVEAIWMDIDASGDAWIPPLKETAIPAQLTESDEQGAVVYVTNKSLPKTQIDGYFVYKHSENEMLYGRRTGWDGDLYMFGNRWAGDISDNLKYRVEYAGQFGHRSGQSICAFGTNNRLTYSFKDKYKNEIYVDYEYLSGDKPGTRSTYEGFDILWGRYPRWTELYGSAYTPESGNTNFTNLHRVGPGWTATPIKNLDVGLRYLLLFADTNPFKNTGMFADGCFRGHLLTPYIKYTFNSHMFMRVMPEFFFPGDYYAKSNNDASTFFRFEMVFTW